MTTIFATALTTERLTKLINEFYYTTTCRIEGENVYNSKGLIQGVEVKRSNGKLERYLFQSK
jgi:hypothetical protein